MSYKFYDDEIDLVALNDTRLNDPVVHLVFARHALSTAFTKEDIEHLASLFEEVKDETN